MRNNLTQLQKLLYVKSSDSIETINQQHLNISTACGTSISKIETRLKLHQVYNLIKHTKSDMLIMQKTRNTDSYFAVFAIVSIDKTESTINNITVKRIGESWK